MNKEEKEKKAEEYLAGWQRARADLLNYKKEEMERFEQVLKFAGEEFILKILPILDNFNLTARQNFLPENLNGQEKERIDKIIQGFLQIKVQLEDFLKSQGVEEIKCGEKFDPNFQEAVEEVEPAFAEAASSAEVASATKAESAGKSGTILEEIQKGYLINGRVLRPAKVKVSK
jgi:molecular chaperone GrpE